MGALLKKIRLNALLSNGLWGLLGAALLFWPAPSARRSASPWGQCCCSAAQEIWLRPFPTGTAHSTQRFGWVPVSFWQSSGCGFYSALFWPPH